MSNYTDFFLNSRADVVQLELLEISHPNFTKTYRIVRNAVNGITVTHEDSSVHTYEYYPLSISFGGNRDDLDQIFKINLGDLGEIVPKELDSVAAANAFSTKPSVLYRAYRSDILTAPMYGPVYLEVVSFPSNSEGCSFEAKAPSLNINRTGETYKIERFPMLRGCL